MTSVTSLRAGLVQLSVSDDVTANLTQSKQLINDAADQGADLILTPEATNLLVSDSSRLDKMLHPEETDPTLRALCDLAARRGVWLSIGSLLLRADTPEEGSPYVNRAFLIGPDGTVAARYDKIHMFDVDLPNGDSIRESARYRPGTHAVVAPMPAPIGLSICYDLRFPHLYRQLALGGAKILVIPAAFHPQTGAAHWHVLLRARAIETGCFVLAAAQTGRHHQIMANTGTTRESFGHSLAVDPWGRVISDVGAQVGISLVDLDLGAVDKARSHIPSLSQTRDFTIT